MDYDQRLAPWQPLSVVVVAQLFAAADFPWWIAGGYAIELAAGRFLREHADVDVLILRRDQEAVRNLLFNWSCWAQPRLLGTFENGNPVGRCLRQFMMFGVEKA